MFRNWADAAPVDIKLGDEITVILDENNAPKYVIAVNYRWGVVDTVNATYERIVFDGFSNEETSPLGITTSLGLELPSRLRISKRTT